MTTSIAASAWAQLKEETSLSYAAFRVYRDLRPEDRSVVKAAAKLGKTPKSLERWCAENKWVERVKEWDAYLDRREVENRLATVDTVQKTAAHDLSTQIKVIHDLVEAHVGTLEQRALGGDLPTVKELRELIALIRDKNSLINSMSHGAAYGIRDDVYEL